MNQKFHHHRLNSSHSRRRLPFLTKILLFFVALITISYIFYDQTIFKPVDITSTTSVVFEVETGETIKEIASKLKDKDLIKSELSFYTYIKFHNLGENILSGKFKLNRTMIAPEIIETLSTLPETEIFTIYEGENIKGIEENLIEQGLTSKNAFTTAVKNFDNWEYYSFLSPSDYTNIEYKLEGYLYPDTYFFAMDTFDAHDIIFKSLDNFENKLNASYPETELNTLFQAIENSEKSLTDIIIMASIIENEVRGKKDRAMVSGILWKRLENNWTIGADATLLYLDDDRKIDSNDLESDNPYNTRKFQGLPPGPICNPSIESIIASLYPEESEYWFYLNTLDTGETIYAKTNDEHNLNKAKHL